MPTAAKCAHTHTHTCRLILSLPWEKLPSFSFLPVNFLHCFFVFLSSSSSPPRVPTFGLTKYEPFSSFHPIWLTSLPLAIYCSGPFSSLFSFLPAIHLSILPPQPPSLSVFCPSPLPGPFVFLAPFLSPAFSFTACARTYSSFSDTFTLPPYPLCCLSITHTTRASVFITWRS